MKLAITGFVIPFVFVYSNELLMQGAPLAIIWAFATAVVGCIFIAFGLTGWARKNLDAVSRIIVTASGFLLFLVRPFWINIVGLVLGSAVILIANKLKKA
jgi:TRAP-type uncharacterized transport system, fused permease components